MVAERVEAAVPPHAARLLPLLGPAVVAGVAYLDPGNVASNMTAGAQYGYLLIWVVVAGNAMAWLIQYMSAKLGIVTGRSLPENLGQRLTRRPARYAFWVQAELVAMATDIAEIIGGAVALHLLFGLPLLAGGVITGVISILLLTLQSRRGPRPFERVITGLVLIIVVGFCAGILFGPPDPGEALAGLVPRFADSGSVLLAASILGATVMPHAIYAHSALTRDRFGLLESGAFRTQVLKATRIDVTIALVVAGGVNVVILLIAAANVRGVSGTNSLEGAYQAISAGLGSGIAVLFAVALLASGLASSSVGAYAGAEIMHGLLHVRLPLLMRRLITLLPALVLLAIGFDPTLALVLSQVVLSFGIPFALIPLVVLTAQRRTMGDAVNRLHTTVLAAAAAAALITLNITLLVLLATG
ncbi:Nramp family divalent metal transporter [Naasia lichenicola]|uniref:Mn(2+) uptake NRAMP transporter MntH n=1 Tax=Naasia lichenicola TaxID=2565933 RepID=A0A4S4FEG8_9MICO|nr:Nramp family divalent metal transporter [Naasia lichenicola]THG28523.1 Mn(2+) uptake NRAMP transporter MntH [Naasia lichenicola]